MFFSGFKFGMLLQLAIGPVCLYIFSLGATQNFFTAFTGVLGVFLADALYIILAIFGVASFIKKESVQRKFHYLGAIIIILFGIELFIGYFNLSFMPKLNIFGNGNVHSNFPFINAFILTGANPLTILFWIGVFTTKTTESNFTKIDSSIFACGALLSTLIFLSFIVLVGSLTSTFLPSSFLSILNAAVGLFLIYFGARKLLKIR